MNFVFLECMILIKIKCWDVVNKVEFYWELKVRKRVKNKLGLYCDDINFLWILMNIFCLYCKIICYCF